MRCSGHVVTQHALVRHCVECGQKLDRKSESLGTNLLVAHHSGTLTSYLGLVFAISNEGVLLCFDSGLRPLIPQEAQIGEEIPSLYPSEGYIYLGSSRLHAIDLITLLQSRKVEKFVLTQDLVVSPVTTDSDSVYCVVQQEKCRLHGWRHQEFKSENTPLTCDIPIPKLRLRSGAASAILAPSITPEHAFIAQRGDDQVHIINLQGSKPSATLPCDGTIVASAATANGMALLLDCGSERKIAIATANRVGVTVSGLERQITWIGLLTDEKYLWGDGGRCFIQTSRGTRLLDVQGNVTDVRVIDGRGWALVDTAINNSALVIDLDSGSVEKLKPIEGGQFAEFVMCDGLMIVSNGREIRSINLS
jgi:hypothetical protein